MRSWVEVSLGRIRANYRAVYAVVGPSVEIMPVVKADAYRHGAVAIAHALENEGATWFAVSNVEEGVALRGAGVSARILVMADSLLGDRSAYEEFRLTPVVHSLEDIPAARVPYHLKLDTGMSRLGTRAPVDQIAAAVRAHSVEHGVELEGLMTHFASAADYEGPYTDQQVANFEHTISGLGQLGIQPRYTHASASTPVAYGRRTAWGNLVRPGHAIYGYVSSTRGEAPAPLLEVLPALTWKVAVLAVKELEPGARIGYGGMHQAQERMRVAVLAAGYADGIPHRLGNRGNVIVNRKLVPIVGAVSMDLTTIDVTSCPELKPGDAVMLLGSEGEVHIDAQQMAKLAGTISYSVLCGIHARVKRVYVD